YVQGFVVLDSPATGMVDCYRGSAWPERFTRGEMLVRRQECRTINEWDSQYQLHARPLTDSRLNESLVTEYHSEPQIREVGGQVAMLLGGIPIVSATCKLDPSAGKINSDVSALCLMLQDAAGNLFWHRAVSLDGELATFGEGGKITGGQVTQVADIVKEFELPRVVVETNGIGGHVPGILREALRQRGLICGVTEQPSTGNKQRRILGAFEPAISSGKLWVHDSVWKTVAEQFRGFNPALTNQPDDYLDAAAGAIMAEPVRIGKPVGGEKSPHAHRDNWTPQSGVFEVTFER
ncbi:MAG: transcriptional regulator, partial [Betaproteobacteria bacterium]